MCFMTTYCLLNVQGGLSHVVGRCKIASLLSVCLIKFIELLYKCLVKVRCKFLLVIHLSICFSSVMHIVPVLASFVLRVNDFSKINSTYFSIVELHSISYENEEGKWITNKSTDFAMYLLIKIRKKKQRNIMK